MIQLRPDCLIIKTSDGDQIPCPAEWLILELLGDSALQVDPEIIRHASAAVLHFFQTEQSRAFVTVAEFSEALDKALRGLGLKLESKPAPAAEQEPRVIEMDLSQFAADAGEGRELFFFPHLRQQVRLRLQQSPQILHFSGLRPCVKQLAGTSRWNQRCQALNDQIVEYLRTCWQTEAASQSCALVVL